MAGYKRPRKTFLLKWPEDHGLAGLEVEMRGLSIEAMFGLIREASELRAAGHLAGKLDRAERMFATFAKGLVSWNLEDDDGPVPATYGGIAAQDLDFITGLVTTWIEEVSSVGTPLPNGSSSGATSPERSLGLESLSKSLSS